MQKSNNVHRNDSNVMLTQKKIKELYRNLNFILFYFQEMIASNLLKGIGQVCAHRRLLNYMHMTNVPQNGSCVLRSDNHSLGKCSRCFKGFRTIFTQSANCGRFAKSPWPQLKSRSLGTGLNVNSIYIKPSETDKELHKVVVISTSANSLKTVHTKVNAQLPKKMKTNLFIGALTFQNPRNLTLARNYATAAHAVKDLKPKAHVVKDSKAKEIKAKVRGIQKDISPLTTRRIVRRKKTKDSLSKDQVTFCKCTFHTINLKSDHTHLHVFCDVHLNVLIFCMDVSVLFFWLVNTFSVSQQH